MVYQSSNWLRMVGFYPGRLENATAMVPLFRVSMRRTNEDEQTMAECDYRIRSHADARLA